MYQDSTEMPADSIRAPALEGFRPGMAAESRDALRRRAVRADAPHEVAEQWRRPVREPETRRTSWVRRMAAREWQEMRRQREAIWWDGVLLQRLLRHVALAIWWLYMKPRSFIHAHLLGTVGRETRDAREVCCRECEFRREKDGRAYCFGENGGRGCGCPTGRYWPFSRLDWLIRLANRACPVGKFRRSWQ